jgi:omega-6 fatty acid desaturase (delta-12 desaturase)
MVAASHAPGGKYTARWKASVERYRRSSPGRAIWQIVNTFVPYALLWYAMYLCMAVSWWLVLPLAVLAAGFLVRVFVICHDCGHGSFFRSRRANAVLGFIAGTLTFVPFLHWSREHARHHASSGDLDRRGVGDIWTLTVQEYLEASRWRRFAYRLARNPFILFVVAPFVMFVVRQRIATRGARRDERESVQWTNLVIVANAAVLSAVFGLQAYLLIQAIIMATAGAVGVWLFYVQHQFEGVYWERGPNWDYTAAALQGSSYYKLPRLLQWFSGNIGFHHIHHLSPAVPNYNLERCHRSDPIFLDVKPLTLAASLRTLTLRLWDEQRQCLVGYPQRRR